MSLHDAIRRNDVALVDELVTGAGTDVLEGLDRLGWSPLRCAVREGRVDCTKLLLNGGVDVDGADKAGVTALHRCCLHGNVDCVRLLLEHKANVFLRDRSGNGTALHWAAEAGAISCVMVSSCEKGFVLFVLWLGSYKGSFVLFVTQITISI